MRAHRVRWTLDADEKVSWVLKSDPGNVDLPRTMPLPDSVANAGTQMPILPNALTPLASRFEADAIR